MPDLLFCLHTSDMILVYIGLCFSTSFLVYKFACWNLMCGQLSEELWRGICGHMMDLSEALLLIIMHSYVMFTYHTCHVRLRLELGQRRVMVIYICGDVWWCECDWPCKSGW